MVTKLSVAAALFAAAAMATGVAAAGQTARSAAEPYSGTIAFVRDGKGDANSLYVIHADGSGLRRIVRPRVGVSGYEWSPNGRWIAYIDARDSLWLVRPDGTGLRRLLRGSKLASMGLSWSPDGKKIAITSPGPFAKVKINHCVAQIYIVPIHGSQQQLPDASASCLNPAWSPRGDEIAYDTQGPPRSGIWVIHPDGSGDRQVLPFGGGPSWSSDGTQLVFNVSNAFGPGGYRSFAVVNADGTHYHVVTNQAYNEYGEVWSPHGRRILYGHRHGGIYVIGSNRQNNHRVTTDSPGQSMAPKLAWSPDGRSIVYAATTGGLYEVGVDGRDKVQLTSPSNGDLDPSWVAPRRLRRGSG